DIRSRCAIHSAEAGTIMIIPREDGLVRIYCQLSELAPGTDGRYDRSSITPDTILQAAQRIMTPYRLEYRYRDWWTVYQIGQRVGNRFSANERIFLAGDAIHTHSPKAGQGMNVSIQDTYNLGWKIAMVAKGLAKPTILKTYEEERRGFAQQLIAFDQKMSRLWSSRLQKDKGDQNGASATDFEKTFREQQLFSSGFGVHYKPGLLTARSSSSSSPTEHTTNGYAKGETCANEVNMLASSSQHLASRTLLGQRFPSFKVINHSDARSWHLANWIKSDGLFHIVLFAGNVAHPEQMNRVRHFAAEMQNQSHFISLQRRRPCGESLHTQCSGERGGVARLLTVHSAPRQGVELHDFPSLLLPYDEELGYDYDSIFLDGESYYDGHGRAYEGYGVDAIRGCVILVRPDQHVAWIGELDNVQGLVAYFAGILAKSL
ncbi:MAG: hypothetical protein Q9169_006854, partial [Polycauliona sp. 2 TL-2023]